MIISFIGINYADAQDIQLATFQEISQIIIDQKLSNNVTASVTLQSTSNQEIRIPYELENKIQDQERIIAIIFTNEENCILGVTTESCIMINISREGIEGGIIPIQDTAKEIGDSLIDDLNELFDTNARYHSVFVHYAAEANIALETSGVVSGQGTVSAVYTTPQEDTQSMFQKLTAILLPREIRESGGFYDLANNLSSEEHAKMTISILPQELGTLYQIKLKVNYPNSAKPTGNIDPLSYLNTNQLERSKYFAQGFYPLNSLLQVVILSDNPVQVKSVNGNLVPTKEVDGENIPTEVTKNGWVFISESGEKIEGMYIFGKEFEIDKNELIFNVISLDDGKVSEIESQVKTDESDPYQMLIVAGIVVVAAIAIVFYLKGIKSKN